MLLFLLFSMLFSDPCIEAISRAVVNTFIEAGYQLSYDDLTDRELVDALSTIPNIEQYKLQKYGTGFSDIVNSILGKKREKIFLFRGLQVAIDKPEDLVHTMDEILSKGMLLKRTRKSLPLYWMHAATRTRSEYKQTIFFSNDADYTARYQNGRFDGKGVPIYVIFNAKKYTEDYNEFLQAIDFQFKLSKIRNELSTSELDSKLDKKDQLSRFRNIQNDIRTGKIAKKQFRISKELSDKRNALIDAISKADVNEDNLKEVMDDLSKMFLEDLSDGFVSYLKPKIYYVASDVDGKYIKSLHIYMKDVGYYTLDNPNYVGD